MTSHTSMAQPPEKCSPQTNSSKAVSTAARATTRTRRTTRPFELNRPQSQSLSQCAASRPSSSPRKRESTSQWANWRLPKYGKKGINTIDSAFPTSCTAAHARSGQDHQRTELSALPAVATSSAVVSPTTRVSSFAPRGRPRARGLSASAAKAPPGRPRRQSAAVSQQKTRRQSAAGSHAKASEDLMSALCLLAWWKPKASERMRGMLWARVMPVFTYLVSNGCMQAASCCSEESEAPPNIPMITPKKQTWASDAAKGSSISAKPMTNRPAQTCTPLAAFIP
mmetsp:Transcript_100579/g.284916  ORF Transcript_100579/g.284916 Transcript_100579/m.284916 type:complete len:282 (-) Transcript_100579:201-1046(-)